MTPAEFDAYIAVVRAYVAEQLALLDTVSMVGLTDGERFDLEQLRASYLELQATLNPDLIAAELEATEHAGRDLTPAELAGLLLRH